MKRFLTPTLTVVAIIAMGGIAFAAFYHAGPRPSKGLFPDAASATIAGTSPSVEPETPPATHVATPKPLKALYMSSWVAAAPKYFDHVQELLDTTEANAVVIDIKDATGKVSFLVSDPAVADTGSPENRIKDITGFINNLHAKHVYVIGRISTFQDPYLAKKKPEWAIHKKSDGSVWKDRKGLPFLDPANPAVADYLIALGKDSYAVGFDEINYDYIRYPSDGNLKDINYQLTNGRTRADTLTEFAKKLHAGLKTAPGLVMSADLFGLTTTETTDMGIGQVFERLIPYFDYVSPMVYPSHYAKNEYGIADPARHPYEIVSKALAGGKRKIDRLNAVATSASSTATATPPTDYSKIRPWLQDFEIGHVPYTADMIKLEMKAVYDAGLDSWMMWDPSNRYTAGAYKTE